MANIDGGALSFKALLDNGQLVEAINETLKRVQGLSDATVAGGKQMDKAFLQTADGIRQALEQIGAACEIHETELAKLEDQYEQLGKEASAAFMAGRDAEARAIKETQAAIKGEMVVRKQALTDARVLSNQLEAEAQKREKETKAIERNAQANKSLRTRIRELKEEMALLVDQGIDQQSEAYKALANELGRLQDIQGDIQRQGQILSNDQAHFQGIIQGLSGISGGFSAATGAISLFAGENENLQKIMTKVQSVMAVTMGLQQVSQTLNKDSAFMLVTVRKAKEMLAVANMKLATALGWSTAAAQALVATLTLGLSVAITAVVAGISYLVNKTNAAKKAQEEFKKSMIEGAYKPIGKIEELSVKYTALGNNIKEKEQFIKDNKKAFEELGVSVTNARDAENLLIKNKDAFVAAQIAKAKAMAYTQQAAEKIKKQMELQAEYESMSDTRSQWVSTSSFGTGYYVQVKNTEKEKKKREIDALNKEIKDGYERAMQEEAKQLKIMQDAGIKATKEYAKGTVGAIQQAISEKQEALNDLVPNSAEWKKKVKEIETLQKQLEKPTKQTTSTTKNGKDPFVEKLEKRKAEYERFKKWQNSSNEEIRKAAKTEFAHIVEGGSSYEAFLKRLHNEISALPQNSRTIAQLQAIHNELAEINKVSFLETFSESLQKELDNTTSLLERLEIIAKKRKEIERDETEVGNDQRQMLTDAEENIVKEIQEDYDKSVKEYEEYLNEKLSVTERYIKEKNKLKEELKKAEAPEQKKVIQTKINTLDKRFVTDKSKMYDELVVRYRSYEEEITEINKDYDSQRRQAEENGNKELIERIEKARRDAISHRTAEEFRNSTEWSKLFEDASKLSTKTLENLIAKFEANKIELGLKLSPKDMKELEDRFAQFRNEISARNPFKGLSEGFKKLKEATSDDDKMAAMAGMLDSAAQAGEQLNAILKDVLGTLETLGVEGTEEIGHVVQPLQGLGKGAADAVMGYMSGNPVQMVGGAIKAIGSVVNYFAGANDRRAERSIKRHQENVRRLTSTYKELEWQTSKALGGDVYQHQQASIENMKQQQKELDAMIQAEQSKKKSDNGKIKEWEERKKELDRAIADKMDNISKDILQTDAKSVADQLGDALVAAFAKGEDAAKSFGEVTNNIMKNAVLNQLKKNLLEKNMDGLLKDLEKKMGYWKGDGENKEFVFDGLTKEEIADFKAKAENATRGFKEAMKATGDLFKEVGLDNDSSLTGAVKGVTEETASVVSGYLNAIRINQGDANDILRQQLSALSQIAQNTAYNRHLEKLDGILAVLKSNQHDPLRSQGLQ